MSTFYLTAYCESAYCVSGKRGNCAEVEIPEGLDRLGFSPAAWGLEQLESLGWSVVDGEFRCPGCTELERLRDLSGFNPD